MAVHKRKYIWCTKMQIRSSHQAIWSKSESKFKKSMRSYFLRPLPFNWFQGQILMLNKYSYQKSFSFRQLALANEKNAADIHSIQNKGKDLYGSALHFLWALTSVQIEISCPAENLLLGLATCYCIWTVSICKCWLFIHDREQKSVWGTCKTFNPCLLVNQGFVKSCWFRFLLHSFLKVTPDAFTMLYLDMSWKVKPWLNY